jgi:hypothetical protein
VEYKRFVLERLNKWERGREREERERERVGQKDEGTGTRYSNFSYSFASFASWDNLVKYAFWQVVHMYSLGMT